MQTYLYLSAPLTLHSFQFDCVIHYSLNLRELDQPNLQTLQLGLFLFFFNGAEREQSNIQGLILRI